MQEHKARRIFCRTCLKILRLRIRRKAQSLCRTKVRTPKAEQEKAGYRQAQMKAAVQILRQRDRRIVSPSSSLHKSNRPVRMREQTALQMRRYPKSHLS